MSRVFFSHDVSMGLAYDLGYYLPLLYIYYPEIFGGWDWIP